jgi:hypothetical protein
LEIQNDNVVVQNPVMNEATFEIDERLVGRYVAENPYVEDYKSSSYFEIKPNGDLEIAFLGFSGLAVYSSERLMLTAYYQENIRTIISFHLVKERYTFPGNWISISFVGDSNFTYFEMEPPLSDFEDVRFVKVN